LKGIGSASQKELKERRKRIRQDLHLIVHLLLGNVARDLVGPLIATGNDVHVNGNGNGRRVCLEASHAASRGGDPVGSDGGRFLHLGRFRLASLASRTRDAKRFLTGPLNVTDPVTRLQVAMGLRIGMVVKGRLVIFFSFLAIRRRIRSKVVRGQCHSVFAVLVMVVVVIVMLTADCQARDGQQKAKASLDGPYLHHGDEC
jgi:hypothetical protein